MSEWADRHVATYSKGMMQRVGVAAAMVNNPDLVILDEPTDGVDPVGRREIRDVLLRMKQEGRTVFVNSHLLSELEMICDRVAILVAGRVVQQGTIDQLTVDRQFFVIEVAGENAADLVRRCVQTRLGAVIAAGSNDAASSGAPSVKVTLPNGMVIDIQGSALRMATDDVAVIQPVIDALRADGLALRRIQSMRPSLEDLFIEAVGGLAGGHEAGAAIGYRGGRP